MNVAYKKLFFFARNSETFLSEFLENPEEMNIMHSNYPLAKVIKI